MIGTVLQPDLEEMIHRQQWNELRDALSELDDSDVAEILTDLPPEDEGVVFRVLPRDRAAAAFTYLPLDQQEELVQSLSHEQMRSILQQMSPDDRTRLLEELPAEVTRRLLETLPPDDLKSARDLLGYPPKTAGRSMTPKYVALRPDMTARQALDHIRRNGHGQETLNTLYVVDPSGKLLQDLRLGTLVLADPDQPVATIDDRPVITIPATTDRDEAVKLFEKYDRFALPVVNQAGQMLGIITLDDILDVAEQVATEDMQKIGGMEALDAPYLDVSFLGMVKKRGGWLSALFLGEMLTATAMSHFEDEIAKAVVLAMFVPLIISSGGNSGSQAATLVVRSMALAEIRLRDWWRVLLRELRTGVSLGAWLGLIGFIRILLWQYFHLYDYGPHYLLVALVVWISLIGVVLFGSVAGSMLPFILRRFGFDPATSSAPFVATLVDVTGLIIYFTVALFLLRGALL